MGPWLLLLVGPLARQIMISLGIGLVTFVGLDAAVSSLIQQVASNANSLPAQAASIFGMAGGFQALSIIAGGITARIALISLKSYRRI